MISYLRRTFRRKSTKEEEVHLPPQRPYRPGRIYTDLENNIHVGMHIL